MIGGDGLAGLRVRGTVGAKLPRARRSGSRQRRILDAAGPGHPMQLLS